MLIKAIWCGLGTWPNGDLEWHQPLKHMTGGPQNNNTNPKGKSKKHRKKPPFVKCHFSCNKTVPKVKSVAVHLKPENPMVPTQA